MSNAKSAQFDVYLTHAVLNATVAGFQGKFTALNMLQQFDFAGVSSHHLSELREALRILTGWNDRLFSGEALLTTADKAPISTDAPKIWQLFLELRKELLALAGELAVFQRVPDAAQNMEAAHYLVAGLGRFAYSREHYIKGLVKYGEVFGPPESVQRWRQALAGCDKELARVHRLFDSVAALEADDKRFFEEIRQRSLKLSGVFRAQAHDMAVIIGLARGGLTYDMAGIDQVEAMDWDEQSVDPQTAGYWAAYEIGPSEALGWIGVDFSDPGSAAAWRIQGFVPQTAAAWSQAGFEPRTAKHWLRSGFADAAEAQAWHEYGFEKAHEAGAWFIKGFSAKEGASWHTARFTPEEAADWRKSGAKNPLAARKQKETMGKLEASKSWPGFTSADSNLAAMTTEIGHVTLAEVDLNTPAPLDARTMLGDFLSSEVPERDPLGAHARTHTPSASQFGDDASQPPPEVQPIDTRFSHVREFVDEVIALVRENRLGAFVDLVKDGAGLIDPADVEVFEPLTELISRGPTPDGRARQVRAVFYLLDTMRDADNVREAAVNEVAASILNALHTRIGSTLPDSPRTQLVIRLALAHIYRHRGHRKANIEVALKALHSVSDLASRRDSPLVWASIKHTQGTALIESGRPEDLEFALESLRAALQVYSPATRPRDWGMTQIDLGDALRLTGSRKAVEDAINCYRSAINVLDQRTNPIGAARAIKGLGLAFRDRSSAVSSGDRTNALEKLTEALQFFRPDMLDAARTHLALARLYHQNVSGRREDNLGKAVGHYRAALQVFRSDAHPTDHRIAQANLASAAENAGPINSMIPDPEVSTVH